MLAISAAVAPLALPAGDRGRGALDLLLATPALALGALGAHGARRRSCSRRRRSAGRRISESGSPRPISGYAARDPVRHVRAHRAQRGRARAGARSGRAPLLGDLGRRRLGDDAVRRVRRRDARDRRPRALLEGRKVAPVDEPPRLLPPSRHPRGPIERVALDRRCCSGSRRSPTPRRIASWSIAGGREDREKTSPPRRLEQRFVADRIRCMMPV